MNDSLSPPSKAPSAKPRRTPEAAAPPPSTEPPAPPFDAAQPDARAGSAFWRVRAVGRRPRVFQTLDLLLGSPVRDYRPAGLHAALRGAAELADLMLPHLPERDRHFAAR